MQSPSSDFNRRRFVQLAAAITLAVGASSSGAAATSSSETEALVKLQPAPRFTPDENTADIIVETLIAWGTTHAFGIVGDGINSIIEALREIHWHPNADEWQYYISGKARMTVRGRSQSKNVRFPGRRCRVTPLMEPRSMAFAFASISPVRQRN